MESKKLSVLPLQGVVCSSMKMAAIHLNEVADDVPTRIPKMIRQYTRKRNRNLETITSPEAQSLLIESGFVNTNIIGDCVKVKQEIESGTECSKRNGTSIDKFNNELKSGTGVFIKQEPTETTGVPVKIEISDILEENVEAKKRNETVQCAAQYHGNTMIKSENIKCDSYTKQNNANGFINKRNEAKDLNFTELPQRDDKMLLNEELDIKEESHFDTKSELATDIDLDETDVKKLIECSEESVQSKSDTIKRDSNMKPRRATHLVKLKKCVLKEFDIESGMIRIPARMFNLLPYKWKCDQCQLQFFSKNSMKSHMKAHILRYQCPVCSEKFRYNYILITHMRSHTGKPLKCDLCAISKVYKKSTSFSSHLNTHLLERLFFCPICQDAFMSKESLFNHITSHTDAEEFKCEHCEQTFPCKSDLNKHASIHSEFSCKICGEDFKLQPSLVRHKKIHSKIHECAFCLNLFPDFTAMQKHTMLHIEQIAKKGLKWGNFRNKFQCRYCHKLFQYRSIVTVHERCHTNERPYNCEVCKKAFKTVGALNGHVLNHSKPLSCDMCGKKFGRKDVLAAHLRQHTGEKPYGCLLCDSNFTQRVSLVYHMKKFHGDGTKEESGKTKTKTKKEGRKKTKTRSE